MVLYIVRHGIAVDRTDPTSLDDPDMPLTPKGVRKTYAAALGLCSLGAKLGILLTSPYVRAVQTAEIFAEALRLDPKKIRVSEALKPSGNPAEAIKEFWSLKAMEVMCCGHVPHLEQMISQLAGTRSVFTSLKKAGVVCFEAPAEHGSWELRWLLTPKILRQLSE
jgi:phosphohistidine phosphatase